MDNIIESYEYYDYRPPISEDINMAGAEFPIIAYNEDIVTQPHKSLLVINGSISVKGGTPLADVENIDTAKIDFVNNGIMNLFDRIDYFVGDNKIDSIRKPGLATTVKGLCSLKPNKAYSLACWNMYENANSVINSSGHFSVVIPLSLIMGFFEDYKQFLYRIPQKLLIYRSTGSTANCFISTDATYKVTLKLKEIVWRIPQIKFSLAYETQIRKEILGNTNYELFFRTWDYHNIVPPPGTTDYTWDLPVSYSKTKYVILAFQQGKQDNLSDDNSTFDLCDLENTQVLLNNNEYHPRERLNLKVSENKCGNLYEMFKNFRQSYYNTEDEDPMVDYAKFIESYPLIVIDCSHQPESIKNSLINIKILFGWRASLPEKTAIHCLLIRDDKAIYNPLTNTVVH